MQHEFIAVKLLIFSRCVQSSWVSEEEFGMGFVDLKPAASPAKHLVTNALPAGSTSVLLSSQNETAGARNISSTSQTPDISNPSKEQVLLMKPVDGKLERSESVTLAKHDVAQIKTRSNALMGNTSNVDPRVTASSTTSQSTAHKASSLLKNSEDIAKGPMLDEPTGKVLSKAPVEFEVLLFPEFDLVRLENLDSHSSQFLF